MNTVDAVTMSMQLEKNSPSRGTASEVGGDISERMDRKKQMERSTVISEFLCVFDQFQRGASKKSDQMIEHWISIKKIGPIIASNDLN